MSLCDIVKGIRRELGLQYPIYVDDTSIYVCGASDELILGLSDALRTEIAKVEYIVTSAPINKAAKIGRYSYRMN